MKLKDILEGISFSLLSGTLDMQVDSIIYDSRKVTDQSLFICIKGFTVDGHHYIEDAIAKGAKVIVIESETHPLPKNVTVVKVNNTRKVMAEIANKFYKDPSSSFNLIGVTGTNGKTSTAHLIEHILKHYNQKVGLIGTIENHIGDKVIKAERTTPESVDVQALFYEMKQASVDSVVMEVSSHALDLNRVHTAHYDVGVFTNLTLDHLDYHKTMENYLKAKTKLFKMSKYGVVNIDDNASEYIINEATCEAIYTFSTEQENANFYAKNILITSKGVAFTLVVDQKEYDMTFAVPGKFSVYNALAAFGATYALGIPIEKIIEALESIKGVKGRFQSITSPKGYSVIVDYAHAPDGLLNVLKSIKEFCKGRIITVFGCGGDRDRSKRPIMGDIAAKYSDFCVITSDNPRTEVPEAIIDEIEKGIIDKDCPYTKITDRKEGIHFALTMAQENDVVLVAGKGHEDYQEIGHTKIHFDDVEVIESFIQGESN